jgi:hypothetical protein
MPHARIGEGETARRSVARTCRLGLRFVPHDHGKARGMAILAMISHGKDARATSWGSRL